MKAVVQRGYGPAEEVLSVQDVQRPACGEGEVLLRARAAGIAKGDWLVAEGLPYIARPSDLYGLRAPRDRVAGLQVAGRVEAVGAKVTGVKEGDEVFGWCRGAFADYVRVPRDQLAPKPADVSFQEAAAVPISGISGFQAVRDVGEVEPGQRVLVIGASGAVGTFAVQAAKARGAEVTGVCGTKNVEIVRSLGAERVLDYTREEITADGRRYDVILDLAGNRPLSLLRRALSGNGTLVMVGGSGGRWTMGFGRTVRALLLSPFVGQRLRALISEPNVEDLNALKELLEAGRVRPVVGSNPSLAEVPRAVAHVGAGRGGRETPSLRSDSAVAPGRTPC